MKLKLITLSLFSLLLFGCATLQEDVYVNSSVNTIIYTSIEEYEDNFILLDNDIHTGKITPANDIRSLISSIETYSNTSYIEPELKGRLCALEGLLNLFIGKTNKATELYKDAKLAQSGDSYVLLLESRLEKTTESQLEKITNLLKIVPEDPVLILEKAKLEYKLQKYALSVASIDKAFLIFDQLNLDSYRTAYSELQNIIWQMYQLSDSNISTSDINPQQELSGLDMIKITQERTSLLNFFTAGTNIKPADLAKRLEKNGFIKSDIQKSKVITKGQCAIFLWDLYIQNTGKSNLSNKYSNAYSKMPNAVSPINDVSLTDDYFDAALGLVENEIMDLPDGVNFFPEQKVTALDFITWIDSCAQKIE